MVVRLRDRDDGIRGGGTGSNGRLRADDFAEPCGDQGGLRGGREADQAMGAAGCTHSRGR